MSSQETPHKTTMPDAVQMCEYLSGFAVVGAVYLYGSVSRESQGNDLDLLIQVDDSIYKKFLKTWWQRGIWQMSQYFDTTGRESDLVMQMLGVDDSAAYTEHLGNRTYPSHLGRVDPKIVPCEWQSKEILDKVQSDYRILVDPSFMDSVARDSRIFLPDNLTFGQPG